MAGAGEWGLMSIFYSYLAPGDTFLFRPGSLAELHPHGMPWNHGLPGSARIPWCSLGDIRLSDSYWRMEELSFWTTSAMSHCNMFLIRKAQFSIEIFPSPLGFDLSPKRWHLLWITPPSLFCPATVFSFHLTVTNYDSCKSAKIWLSSVLMQ